MSKVLMKLISVSFLVIALSLLFSCSDVRQSRYESNDQFSSELLALKEYFQIPGLAVSVDRDGRNVYRDYLGFSDIKDSIAVDSSTLFPIASITKTFSGVLVMKLVEQGKLSLDDPINNFLANKALGDSVLVKHVLSHTSQGDVGSDFYYSSRFGLITKVIEQASGSSFKDYMNQEIINPLKLQQTFLLQDSSQIQNVAKPYLLGIGLESGFVDYGYSSSAGIVSNLDDLAVFNRALDDNTIISKESKEIMFSSFKDDLAYGYGIFHQEFQNVDLLWSYGQYDCYSSLLLKIPSKGLTLTLLANNSLLSDPARLIYGDATSSLFVLSFLKNYVFEMQEMPLFENVDSISQEYPNSEFYRKKLLAQALAESYMARYEPSKIKNSAKLINYVFDQYPDYLAYADLNLMHNLSFLKDVAFYMDLDEFKEFDLQLQKIGNKLEKLQANNPYVHTYMGTFYARKGENEKAKHHFESILNASNFSQNWYTHEAQQWLKELK